MSRLKQKVSGYLLIVLGSIAVLGYPFPLFAGDPMWHLTHKSQDVLALIEIVHITNGQAEAKPFYFFPQGISQPNSLFLDQAQSWLPKTGLVAGKKYFASLQRKSGNVTDEFVPQWGLYEVVGTSYKDVRFAEHLGGDAAAFEWFIHSGGRDVDFSFDEGRVYVQKDAKTSVQIYPPVHPMMSPIPSSEPPLLSEKSLQTHWRWLLLLLLVSVGIRAYQHDRAKKNRKNELKK